MLSKNVEIKISNFNFVCFVRDETWSFIIRTEVTREQGAEELFWSKKEKVTGEYIKSMICTSHQILRE